METPSMSVPMNSSTIAITNLRGSLIATGFVLATSFIGGCAALGAQVLLTRWNYQRQQQIKTVKKTHQEVQQVPVMVEEVTTVTTKPALQRTAASKVETRASTPGAPRETTEEIIESEHPALAHAVS